MGAHIPERVADSNRIEAMVAAGCTVFHRGKVRDTVEVPGHPDLLLQVASDRGSAFDTVLPALFPQKGAVLTALTVFWFTNLFHDVPNHLVAYGSGIDQYLPDELRGNRDLQSRALVVQKLTPFMIECVARGNLTGSGWRDYENTGAVGGHQLPPGLHDGSRLQKPIYTPATKAVHGHDVNISRALVAEQYGDGPERLTLMLFGMGREYAKDRGIIIADTKFEFAEPEDHSGVWVVIDELLTPDSSRFWDAKQWLAAARNRKSPPGFDKEPVRQFLLELETPFGINFPGLDLSIPDQRRWVEEEFELPNEVVEATSERYLTITHRLAEVTLHEFQAEDMKIAAA